MLLHVPPPKDGTKGGQAPEAAPAGGGARASVLRLRFSLPLPLREGGGGGHGLLNYGSVR